MLSRQTCAFALLAAALAAGPALAGQVTIKKPGTTGILVWGPPNGETPVLTVSNTSPSNKLGQVKLESGQNTLSIKTKGNTACKGITKETLLKREGYFYARGTLGVGTETAAWQTQVHESNNIDMISNEVSKTIQVPLAALKAAPQPFDPGALVMLKAHQSGDKLNYLRSDQSFTVQLPVRFEAVCKPYLRYKVKKQTVIEAGDSGGSIAYLFIPVRIDYQGDPDLIAFSPSVVQSPGQPGGAKPGFQAQPAESAPLGIAPAQPKAAVKPQRLGKDKAPARRQSGAAPRN